MLLAQVVQVQVQRRQVVVQVHQVQLHLVLQVQVQLLGGIILELKKIMMRIFRGIGLQMIMLQ